MNNQVKLISTDILIHELKKRINQLPESRIHLGGYNTGKKNAYEVMIEFLKTYNPDTPPVPTIKPGDKVRHSDLGEGTAVGYGEQVIEISTAKGNFDVSIKDLEVVE